MIYSTRRFVLSLALCYFVLVFFKPLALRLPRLGKRERANLSAFRTFVRFALVWFCLFPLPLRVWNGLWLVIVALPGFFSYIFFNELSGNHGKCMVFRIRQKTVCTFMMSLQSQLHNMKSVKQRWLWEPKESSIHGNENHLQ